MTTATLAVLASAAFVALAGIVVVIVTVGRSLGGTARAVSELGARLADAEDRLARMHQQVAAIGEDLGDVGAVLAEHRRTPAEEAASSHGPRA